MCLFACHKISRNMLNYLYRYFLRFYIKYQFYIHIIFYILYLRRVTTKIAKVHLENLKNHFNSTKVCRQACVFSIVCLTLSQFGQGKRNKEEEMTRYKNKMYFPIMASWGMTNNYDYI